MPPKVPTSDSGTATLGMMVAATLRRKTKTTSTTSDDGDGQADLDVLEGGADGRGAVERHRQLDRRRHGGPERGQERVDAIDGLDHVRPGLPEQDEHDGALAVGDPARADVFDRAHHLGDVAEPYRRSLLVGDDHRPVLVGVEELVGGVDRPRGGGPGQLALRRVGVHRAQSGPHVLEPVAQRAQAPRVDLDADGGLGASADEDLPHAFHLGELLGEDRVRRVVEPARPA